MISNWFSIDTGKNIALNANPLFRISFLGDLYIYNDTPNISDQLLQYFRSCEHVAFNLEAPVLTKSDIQPIQKCGPNLYHTTEVINFLNKNSLNLALLANNHINDYGPMILNDTESLLSQNNICSLGKSPRLNANAQYKTFDVGDLKIALIAISDPEFSSASADLPGSCEYDSLYIPLRVSQISQNHDFVIVSFHGGEEDYVFPSPNTKKRLQALINAGADVVIGHHPHVIQGIDKVAPSYKPIIYSLGNFFMPKHLCHSNLNTKGLIVNIDVNCNYEFECSYSFIETSTKLCIDFISPDLAQVSQLLPPNCSDDLLYRQWEHHCEQNINTYTIKFIFGLLALTNISPRMIASSLLRLHLRKFIVYCFLLAAKYILSINRSSNESSILFIKSMLQTPVHTEKLNTFVDLSLKKLTRLIK